MKTRRHWYWIKLNNVGNLSFLFLNFTFDLEAEVDNTRLVSLDLEMINQLKLLIFFLASIQKTQYIPFSSRENVASRRARSSYLNGG